VSKPSGAVISLLRHGHELPAQIAEREAAIRAECLSGCDPLGESVQGGVRLSAAERLIERLESDPALCRLRGMLSEYNGILSELSDRQKEFVRLRYEQDLSLAEVASRMEISLRGAKWYVSEIFKALAGRAIGAASKAA
jgi:hypothetical protein